MIDSDTARDPVEELAEEFLHALRRGDAVSVEQYAARLPECGARIRELFPTLLMVESLKSHDADHGVPAPSCATRLPEGIRSVGDFRIVQEIGRGGMGVVYEAVQESLQRRVALKVMSHSLLHSNRQVQRFEREARSAARLHHTNIIPVFGIGHEEGVHYYVMQYIEGLSLAEILGGAPTAAAPAALRGNWKRIARIGQQIASALRYAHEQGVLHRDIKPANLLLDPRGNAWIGDFGLAKATEQDEVTIPGDAVGTLRYMPPEQINGGTDERSDIYSFGLTLYELLTWQQAFGVRDRGHLVHSIMQGCPIPPRRLQPKIPRDLETIVLKSIAPDPESRYQTAAELSEDLERYIDDVPVRARRASSVEQLWRWSRRNPVVARLASATVVLSLLVALVACLGFAQTRSALLRESQQKQQAVSAERQAGLERERAEANLRLALTAFNEIARDLANGREPAVAGTEVGAYSESHFLPLGSHDATTVLRTLLKFYAEFAAQNGSHPQLQNELVQAHRRLGDIHRQFGHVEDAERAYRQAVALCDGSSVEVMAAAGQPGEAPLEEVERASLCIELGTLFHAVGRYSDARTAYQDADVKLALYLELHPGSRPARFELARLSKYRGDLFRVQGQIDLWGEQNRHAIRILAGLVSEDGSHPEYRFLLASAHRNRPPFLRDGTGKKIRQEFKGHAEAIRLLTALAEEYPDVPRYRFELSATYALVHLWKPTPWRSEEMSVKELKNAERRLRKSLALCRELVSTYPAVPDYADALACNLVQMGTVKERLGELEEAERFFTWATARSETLVKRFDSFPKYNDSLSMARHALGGLLHKKKQYAAARPVLEEAIATRQKLVATTPHDRRGRAMLARQYEDLSLTLRELGDPERAEEVAHESRALRRAPQAEPESGKSTTRLRGGQG